MKPKSSKSQKLAAKSSSRSNRPRVALVDDDENIHVLLSDLARLGDYELIKPCSTAREALRRLPREKPDVVIMDIRLPDMSGNDCTAKLKAIMPELPIIVLTGCADSQRLLRALMAGASGFLVKPITVQEILSAIQEALKGGFPLGRNVFPLLVEIIHQFRHVWADAHLGRREQQILACVFRGLQDKEIASELGIGIATVRTFMRRMFSKIDVHSRREVVEKFLREG